MKCERCGVDFERTPGPGRPPRFCSGRCRVASHRADRLPAEFDSRRWVRCAGKRPITVTGSPASSTDPSTWSSRAEVSASSAGDGFGVMLGDGLACFDLDHVTDEQVATFISQVDDPILFVERSVSGTGAHVFVSSPEGAGWRRIVDGMSVECYSRARFIRMTLNRL